MAKRSTRSASRSTRASGELPRMKARTHGGWRTFLRRRSMTRTLTHRNSRAFWLRSRKRRGADMSQETLRIQKISGLAGMVPCEDTQRGFTVCKLVDTTTCIGCKACEVACVEWNDMPFSPTTFDNTYQTMPDTRWNYCY